MKTWGAALLLLAAASALGPSSYPYYRGVVRSPRDPDQLYYSSAGPVNESWYFEYAVTLNSVIVPSQVTDPLRNGTYEEAIDLLLYETTLVNFWEEPETHLVATGAFRGAAGFGEELDIALWDATAEGPPAVGRYVSSTEGVVHTLNVVFKKAGTYPWYEDRNLSHYTPLHSFSNGAGMAIGLTNS